MKVVALCTVGSGLDVLDAAGVALSGLIGLAPREAEDAISGFADMAPYAAARGIPYVAVESYNLANPADRARIEALAIDIVLVVGWQRLVPDWLIRKARIGVLGIHGSAGGIAAGRGRSPQNWAIMLRSNRFSVSLFLIAPGIDDGPVLATREYELTEFDDIADSYRKLSIVTGRMIAATLRDDPGLARRSPQTGLAFYLPQRRPEDGAIDWSRDAASVLAFIRALARPYPGAFSQIDGARVRFWRAVPYRLDEMAPERPGTVTARFQDGSLLIACGCGHILATDWDVIGWNIPGDAPIQRGTVLPGANFREQIAKIVARHRAKYPDLPVAPAILAFQAD